jgi:hypothetical protein
VRISGRVFLFKLRMAKLMKQLAIHDPVSRAERARTVTIEGPELLLDCLDRETSCLDLQMLGEAADGSPSFEITFRVKVDPIKRRRSWR